jgi:hypothetical protein
VKVLRWRGGARCSEGAMVAASELQELIDLPCGTGCDHAEGLALFHRPGGRKAALLVVHDQPASHRQPGESTLLADVWPLG